MRLPYRGAGVLLVNRGPEGPEVLLLRRSIRPDRGVWSIPGGAVDRGETFRCAAVRELSEEAFAGADPIRELKNAGALPADYSFEVAPEHVRFNIPGVLQWRTYLMEVTRRMDVSRNWENDAHEWYPVHQLPSRTHRGVKSSLHAFRLWPDRSSP